MHKVKPMPSKTQNTIAQFASPARLAQVLGVATSTILRQLEALGAVRLGHRWLIPIRHIEERFGADATSACRASRLQESSGPDLQR